MDGDLYHYWVETVFLPYTEELRRTGKILLIIDNFRLRTLRSPHGKIQVRASAKMRATKCAFFDSSDSEEGEDEIEKEEKEDGEQGEDELNPAYIDQDDEWLN
eukprot:jgi/Tetstr1/424728/TSEL_015246.t1